MPNGTIHSRRHPHPVRDDLDRLGADEVQEGGVAVRRRRQDRDDEVCDAHTYKTRAKPEKPDSGRNGSSNFDVSSSALGRDSHRHGRWFIEGG